MTEQECWEAGRGVWVCNPALVLDHLEIEILNHEKIVVAVGTIESVIKRGGKYAVNGQLLIGDPRVGKPAVATNASRNPVKYIN
ncbi:UNVERIFIED_CONTAM: hypothetical protein Q9R71_35385 [Actinomycetes bacterium ARC8]|nr:hypothetical protein [Actinomycetes bacterium ARC8]